MIDDARAGVHDGPHVYSSVAGRTGEQSPDGNPRDQFAVLVGKELRLGPDPLLNDIPGVRNAAEMCPPLLGAEILPARDYPDPLPAPARLEDELVLMGHRVVEQVGPAAIGGRHRAGPDQPGPRDDP